MASTEMWVGTPNVSKRPAGTGFVILTWLLAAPVAAYIAWGVLRDLPRPPGTVVELIVWVGALALLNMFELQSWGGRALSPDVPVVIAIALTFHPTTAGLIGWLGA